MEKGTQGNLRTTDLLAGRGWLIVTLAAMFVGLILLWKMPASVPPSSTGDLESRDGTTDPPQLASPSSVKITPSAERPSELADGVTDTPVVSASDIADHVAKLLDGSPDLDIELLSTMISISSDSALPLEDRIVAIRWLARLEHDEAFDVLESLALGDASPVIRSAVATALAESGYPGVQDLLVKLLADEEPGVVLSAIQGLANHNDPETLRVLAALVADQQQTDEIRSAAAAALGRFSNVTNDLLLALENSDEEMAIGVLTGLARQPFAQSEIVFRELFADPGTPTEMKLGAIDALGEGTPEAAGLLLELARSNEDPELRSAAIDALMFSDEPGNALDALGELALSEPSADVRATLYNALSLHAAQASAEPNAYKLINNTLSETVPRTKLEGYRMVASMLNHEYQTEIADNFDRSMVTWLQQSAEFGDDRYIRFLSIDALRLANTPGAHQALVDLSQSTDATVSNPAQKALRLIEKTAGTGSP